MFTNDCEKFYALCFQHTKDAQEAKNELLQKISLSALWEFAEQEDAVSIIGESILVSGNITDLANWKKEVAETENRLEKYFELSGQVFSALAKQDIPIVALKNAGLVLGYGYSLASTPMGDVDLLIDPDDFLRAHDEILKLGFTLDDRSPFNHGTFEDALASGGTEYRYNIGNGEFFWLELQWRPVAGRWIQPKQEPTAKSLIEKAKFIDAAACYILSPEDNLLQVSLHTAKHTYVRAPGFRLHSDVHRIVISRPVNWERFCTNVEELNVCTAVYLSLLISHKYLETPIPQTALSRLNKQPIKNFVLYKWILRVGLFGHNRKKFSKLGYILFNLALYDNLSGMLRAIFPDYKTMQQSYGARSKLHNIYCHLRRIYDLLTKRAQT